MPYSGISRNLTEENASFRLHFFFAAEATYNHWVEL